MHQIEIIGMRKNRDLKIVITIIILAIISIFACLGIIFYNKYNTMEVVADANIIEEANKANGETAENGSEEGSAKSEQDSSEGENQENTTSDNTDNDNKSNNSGTLDSNEASNDVSTNDTPKVTEEQKEFIDKISNIYNGEEGKRVFLTFDDGPTNVVTPSILDTLNKYNVKATFFVLGTNAKKYPELVKREYEEGHYIANHGYSHKYSKIYKSVDTVLEEYNQTEQLIRDAIGISDYSSNLFRFPGGSKGGPYEEIKKEARKKLKSEGIAYLDWSALTYDAAGADTTDEILCNLKETINGWNNVVILMHDAADKKITADSLDDVIEYLQSEGYAFKNIYDL